MRFVFLLALLLLAQNATAANAYGAYVKLDGRWYGVTSALAWDLDTATRGLFVDDVTATNCRRSANNAFPTLGAGTLIGLGTNFLGASLAANSLQSSPPTYVGGPLVLEITSADGDIVCGGQVAAPDLAPPQEVPLFSNGFE